MTPEVVSVNIGEPVTIEWQGKKVQTGIWKYPVDGNIHLGTEDVKSDHVIDRKYHGGKDKACYLYSADHYPYWEKLTSQSLNWGMFGENITIEGFHEAEVYIGDIYQLGNAVVQVTQPRQPCYKLNIRFDNAAVLKMFIESGFPGAYVRIIQTGTVQKGNKLILQDRQDNLSVQQVFNMLYAKETDENLFSKAMENPYLAESCRKDLIKKRDYRIQSGGSF